MATELQIAEQIRDGLLPSPQRLGTMELWAIRITGTGASYRAGLNEYVWRDESHYLNEEFLRRCNGLPVVWEHPEDKPKLDSEEFVKRVVGTIMLPYISGNEVWGIARIYDADAIARLNKEQMSTSPGVVFVPSDGNESYELPNGRQFLIEGKPSLLDHIALVEAGVWDKGGPPTGVSTSTVRDSMSEEDKAAAAREDAAKLDKILGSLDSLGKRMDAYEESEKSRKDAEEAEKREAEEKAAKDRKDAEMAACDADKDDKREDRKDRKDAEPETAMADRKDRKDAEETEEEKRALEKANEAKAEKERDDARKDAAAQAEIANLKQQLASVTAFMTEMKREVSPAERDALAAAQSRADSVAAMFGDRVPAPMPGEASLAYRKRLLDRFKTHSPQFKESRFDSADAGVIDAIEGIIYADAANAARVTKSATPGGLFPIVRADAAGRQITTYEGDIGAFMAPFMAEAVVTPIRNPKNR